ncbi:MAG: aldo/keto reductase, partial [Spirochaetota bacterium]|nr:aldo/keto reductase [Spirochaetota bacterium]
MIKGFSTAPGTEAYSKRFSDISFSRLGRTNLTVSLGGFGCYRVDRSVEDHFTAMSLALKSGVNLIDTSSNYSDGASEELVGAVLTSLIESGDLRREEVVVITKAGYLQGGNLRVKQQREAEGKPFPDLVPYDLNLEHCIHPDFLEDQINRSLNRLSLQSVDVFLLHNPEYYLGWANKQGIPLKDARDEYHSRIDSAFRYLEWEIADGRIKSYGISSNSFPATPEDYQFTSLEKIWTIAEAISPSHSFKVIQFPMNLFERQAITAINQSENRSLIDFARHTDLGTLINRPLNAFVNNKLIRLASVEQP